MDSYIEIKNARVHNLKNLSVTLPHGKLIVITGLSGSGKSSLAFDTLFAEGQRRYVESLSSYARQFLGRINKPDADSITGIAPAIAIEQKVSSRNPRSTVGTTTEIYDYLKLLFARLGRLYSPVTGKPVRIYEPSDVVDAVIAMPEGSPIIIATTVADKKDQLFERITTLVGEGYERFYYKGETLYVGDLMPRIDEIKKLSDLYVVIDRLTTATDGDTMSRLADSIQSAYAVGDQRLYIIGTSDKKPSISSYSSRLEADGIEYIRPNEHLFSFNNPMGACPECEGYGKTVGIDENLVVPDRSKSVYDGAIACWKGDTMKKWQEEVINSASQSGFPIHRAYHKLSNDEKKQLWHGTPYFKGIDKFFKSLEREKYKIQYRVLLSRYTGKRTCPLCGGGRLRKEATYVKIEDLTIVDMVSMPIEKLQETINALKLDSRDKKVAVRLLTEIKNRLSYLVDVGLGYLTLDRLSNTLSGGESQRINLATSLGSSLVGSMYILDEPSIGLHSRDTARLINVLLRLRDLGNTVIVVEHDIEIMKAADLIVDIGPRAGIHGGELVFIGNHKELKKAKGSLTADYLNGKLRIEVPSKRRPWHNYIEIKGARENNLKSIDVKFPLGIMTCITGVSGSGKSSLVKGVLYPALSRHFNETGAAIPNFDTLEGDISLLGGVQMVDQNPIGRSSRSNPATYIKAYDDIRKLFAEQQASKTAGLSPSHFSFNIAGGRCEECQGEGVIRVEMQFMADIEMICESCNGRRFKDEILEVRYNEKSIDEVLNMPVDEAIEFFSRDKKNPLCKKIIEKLSPLKDVGLGYVKLGQSSSTLSGGESQRVKLASFLIKENAPTPQLFIFDEPTTGLHFHDIKKLLDAFYSLLDRGHTLIVVEHNLDVIKCADYVVDLADGGVCIFLK